MPIQFLKDAHRAGCQALLTGEARFHACLEARDLNVAMILPGHYATERPAMETLATRLVTQFPETCCHRQRQRTRSGSFHLNRSKDTDQFVRSIDHSSRTPFVSKPSASSAVKTPA